MDNNLIPFFGTCTEEGSKEVKSGAGNFMHHGMTAYQWFHQSTHDIENTIEELKELLAKKYALAKQASRMIDDFDWTHMYSDDSRPSRVQEERNRKFNELIKLCPADVKHGIYKIFIVAYLNHAPHANNPMSFEDFCKGINI